jgi:hypothetical protein
MGCSDSRPKGSGVTNIDIAKERFAPSHHEYKNGHVATTTTQEEKAELLKFIHSSMIGGDELLDTPFGQRRMCYSDWTASGRSLTFIEEYIRTEVLPLYANTHSEAADTGMLAFFSRPFLCPSPSNAMLFCTLSFLSYILLDTIVLTKYPNRFTCFHFNRATNYSFPPRSSFDCTQLSWG